jgi:hypothetical protein
MQQHLDQLATALRKAIEAAALASALDQEAYARTLRRALALLCSAQDEIDALRAVGRGHG